MNWSFWEFRSHEGIICAHDLHLEEIPWEHCYGRIRGVGERSLRAIYQRSDMGRLRGLASMASLHTGLQN